MSTAPSIYVSPIARKIILEKLDTYKEPGMAFYENLMRIPSIHRALARLYNSLQTEEITEPDNTEISAAASDILRSVVVFTHASLESFLRDIVKPNSNQSFNSGSEITRALKKGGIDAKYFQKHIPIIDTMIQRRHKIVHKADNFVIHGKRTLTPLTLEEVNIWTHETLKFFFCCVFAILVSPKVIEEMNERLKSEGQTHTLITIKEINQVFIDRYPEWEMPSLE